MRAKWLWSTTVHIALGVILAAQALMLWFAEAKLIPEYIRFRTDNLLELNNSGHPVDFLGRADSLLMSSHYLEGTFWDCYWFAGPALLAGWVAFEWRARGENKTLIRLSTMGLAAAALTIYCGLILNALIVHMIVGMTDLKSRPAEVMVRERSEELDAAIVEFEEALAAADWNKCKTSVSQATSAANRLIHLGAAAPVLASSANQAQVDARRTQLREARERLTDAWNATMKEDKPAAEVSLQRFHELYDPQVRTK